MHQAPGAKRLEALVGSGGQSLFHRSLGIFQAAEKAHGLWGGLGHGAGGCHRRSPIQVAVHPPMSLPLRMQTGCPFRFAIQLVGAVCPGNCHGGSVGWLCPSVGAWQRVGILTTLCAVTVVWCGTDPASADQRRQAGHPGVMPLWARRPRFLVNHLPHFAVEVLARPVAWGLAPHGPSWRSTRSPACVGGR